MFFRRERPKTLTFQQKLEALRQAGFTVSHESGGERISRNGCATVIQEDGSQVRLTSRVGILLQDEIAVLVDGGFQKFLQTPSGRRKPATAEELKAIHDFEEDLKETLGLESIYNESLGTVSTFYLYDRLKDRDLGVPKRPWES
ncbi:MAG TPA: hypothetical protein VG672_14500 [Bryobacteraceae bacterium]|jgi:hypothetical protein|nr:hypothetical protein [Bryobacteraceae bacterium]